jgi:hypothetical protein
MRDVATEHAPAPETSNKENIMKRLITAAMLLAFGAAMVGCEASAKVGDPNSTDTTTTSTNGGSYEKKTTTYHDPVTGDTSSKTTVKTNTP